MVISVVVSDCHWIVREGLKLLFDKEWDIRVIGSAERGVDAISRILELKPSVAIMDLVMPGLTGLEVTSRVCEKHPGTRCIIFSMYADPEYIARALQAGALGYLVKDATGREIIDAVRVVHSGRQYLSRSASAALNKIESLSTIRRLVRNTPVETLSPREREILQLVAEGRSSVEIGRTLNLSRKTVETYRCRLMRKLGIHGVPALVRFAFQHGFIGPE